MNLEHYYWCFPKVVPERICDDIVKYALSMKDKMAVTGQQNIKKLDPTQIKKTLAKGTSIPQYRKKGGHVRKKK